MCRAGTPGPAARPKPEPANPDTPPPTTSPGASLNVHRANAGISSVAWSQIDLLAGQSAEDVAAHALGDHAPSRCRPVWVIRWHTPVSADLSTQPTANCARMMRLAAAVSDQGLAVVDLLLCEQVGGSDRVSAGMAAGGGDVGLTVEAVAADREVAHGRHDRGSVAGADLAVVLGEGHVADPGQAILHRSVVADDRGEMVSGFGPAQVGDRVDGFRRANCSCRR